jgi:hypothetical protein
MDEENKLDPDAPRDPDEDLVEFTGWLVVNTQFALRETGLLEHTRNDEEAHQATLEFLIVNMVRSYPGVAQKFFHEVFLELNHSCQFPPELIARFTQDSEFTDIITHAYGLSDD